jgi:hypothetical protein
LLRLAIRRIRELNPEATHSDIELVLAAAFDLDVSLVSVKALMERREGRKSERGER